jgi:hypothetical protein
MHVCLFRDFIIVIIHDNGTECTVTVEIVEKEIDRVESCV